jgi:hypothetical protein
MVAHVWNSSTWKAEPGGLKVIVQPVCCIHRTPSRRFNLIPSNSYYRTYWAWGMAQAAERIVKKLE